MTGQSKLYPLYLDDGSRPPPVVEVEIGQIGVRVVAEVEHAVVVPLRQADHVLKVTLEF